MSFLSKVEHCNRRDMSGFVPFYVAGVPYGWLTPERGAALLAHKDVFQLSGTGVALHRRLTTPAARSRAVAEIAPALVASGLFYKLRKELYAVRNHWSERPAFNIDRGLVPGFGVRAYGVHVNGVVEKPSGLHLWIGTRAADLKVEPGKLDNMVAGGQPAGLGLMENLVKKNAARKLISRPSAPARPARSASSAMPSNAPKG